MTEKQPTCTISGCKFWVSDPDAEMIPMWVVEFMNEEDDEVAWKLPDDKVFVEICGEVLIVDIGDFTREFMVDERPMEKKK